MLKERSGYIIKPERGSPFDVVGAARGICLGVESPLQYRLLFQARQGDVKFPRT